MTAFYSRHADICLHVGLYSCKVVYGTVSPFHNKYTFYTFPLNLGEIYQTGALESPDPPFSEGGGCTFQTRLDRECCVMTLNHL